MLERAALAKASKFSGSLSLAFLLMAAVTGHAQAPAAPPSPLPGQAAQQPRPVTGFVSGYEILRTVRAAGFDPLAPPLREGTTYVLRATDFRGILMRVVLDARTGVIRDVTRIVPAVPGPYGMMAPPYGPPMAEPYGRSPYGSPAEYESPGPDMGLGEDSVGAPPPRPPAKPSVTKPSVAMPSVTRPVSSGRPPLPPLPRPRPAAFASQKSKTSAKVEVPAPPSAQSATLQAQTGASADVVGVSRGAAPATSAAPDKRPPLPPFND